MTPNQIQSVQGSFARLAPHADEVAQPFDQRLFGIEPSLRAMFKPDIAEQRDKPMAVLGTAVASLGRVDEIAPVLHSLGHRHARYGVQGTHHDTVTVALIATLEPGLGEAFTRPLREAWTTACGLLAGAMKEGAREWALA